MCNYYYIHVYSFTTKDKVLTLDTMHPLIKNVEYAVRGAVPIRAEALSKVRNKIVFLSEELLTHQTTAITNGSIQVEL